MSLASGLLFITTVLIAIRLCLIGVSRSVQVMASTASFCLAALVSGGAGAYVEAAATPATADSTPEWRLHMAVMGVAVVALLGAMSFLVGQVTGAGRRPVKAPLRLAFVLGLAWPWPPVLVSALSSPPGGRDAGIGVPVIWAYYLISPWAFGLWMALGCPSIVPDR